VKNRYPILAPLQEVDKGKAYEFGSVVRTNPAKSSRVFHSGIQGSNLLFTSRKDLHQGGFSMTTPEFCISREKHLDHMVRVVPFIVTAYAIQCYFILQMDSQEFGVNGLFVLGGMLIAMISAFITYDLTHAVIFHEHSLTISINWLGYKKEIFYQDIISVEITEPGQSFSTLQLKMKSGKKFGFYFIDEADKIKQWIEQKRTPEMQVAA
jgi:hypothetical protein